MYRRILVPLDGSKRAEAILPHVEKLANCLESEIILLRVYKTNFSEVEYYGYDPEYYNSIRAEAKEDVVQYLNEVRANCLDSGLPIHIIAREGPVVEKILEVAREENADLIAMSSHGRTGLAQVFYGSVAAGILHRVDRPLLLVRAEAIREKA